MASIVRRRTTSRFQIIADVIKIAKTDREVTRKPNSGVDVSLRVPAVVDGDGATWDCVVDMIVSV